MTIATKVNTTMASLSTLSDGIALTHFIVAESCERAPFSLTPRIMQRRWLLPAVEHPLYSIGER